MSTATIVCVGTAALDTLAIVDRLPHHDERIEALDWAVAGGGNAATAAVAIARLGVAVEFSGVVGDDEAGERVVAQLTGEGVGTSLIERRRGITTAQSLIVVTKKSGNRAIVTKTAPAPTAIPGGFDWVHVDKAGHGALGPRGHVKARVSLDDGNPVPNLDLRAIDLYVPTAAVLGERFPGLDSVAAGHAAIAAGCRTVVATDGGNGSIGMQADAEYRAAGYPVDVVSTLGAGDVFHGALLAAVALGKTLPDAIIFANITAALSCRSLDGRSSIPSRDEVEAIASSWNPTRGAASHVPSS